jgi:hypothetical protein
MPDRVDNAMPAQEGPDAPALPPSGFSEEQPDLFDELPTDDEWEGDDDTEKAAPEERRSVHGGARVGTKGAAHFPLPSYLANLCSLPGVNRADFEGIDCRTAVIELWGRGRRGSCHDKLPIAHLAPDALEVLPDLGFSGHVRASVFQHDTDRKAAFNTAFKLPPKEGEEDEAPAGAGADEAIRVENDLRAEIDELRKQVAEKQPVNPLHGIREMLGYVRDTIREVGEIKQELSDVAGGLDLSTDGGEGGDEGGGTAQAVMAVVGAKVNEALGSPTVKRAGKALLGWILKKFGGDSGAIDDTEEAA